MQCYIADSVASRAAKGWNFGVAIIPEGIVEFVPEFSVLIAEINELLAGAKADAFNALPTWAAKYEFIKNGTIFEEYSWRKQLLLFIVMEACQFLFCSIPLGIRAMF